jgi:hypothetical protein
MKTANEVGVLTDGATSVGSAYAVAEAIAKSRVNNFFMIGLK